MEYGSAMVHLSHTLVFMGIQLMLYKIFRCKNIGNHSLHYQVSRTYYNILAFQLTIFQACDYYSSQLVFSEIHECTRETSVLSQNFILGGTNNHIKAFKLHPLEDLVCCRQYNLILGKEISK